VKRLSKLLKLISDFEEEALFEVLVIPHYKKKHFSMFLNMRLKFEFFVVFVFETIIAFCSGP